MDVLSKTCQILILIFPTIDFKKSDATAIQNLPWNFTAKAKMADLLLSLKKIYQIYNTTFNYDIFY